MDICTFKIIQYLKVIYLKQRYIILLPQGLDRCVL